MSGSTISILEIKNLTKIFLHPENPKIKIPILSSVSLKIDSSKINFITGESGCGKTTLLNIIKGNLKFDAGEIIYEGKNLHLLREIEKLKILRSFVYLDQNLMLNIYINLSVIENIKYNYFINKLDKRKADDEIKKIIKILKLENILNNSVKNLSGGELQKLGLAKSLIIKPKILLLDEPFSHIDPDTTNNLIKFLKDLINESSVIILISTHNIDLIESYDFNYNLKNHLIY